MTINKLIFSKIMQYSLSCYLDWRLNSGEHDSRKWEFFKITACYGAVISGYPIWLSGALVIVPTLDESAL